MYRAPVLLPLVVFDNRNKRLPLSALVPEIVFSFLFVFRWILICCFGIYGALVFIVTLPTSGLIVAIMPIVPIGYSFIGQKFD